MYITPVIPSTNEIKLDNELLKKAERHDHYVVGSLLCFEDPAVRFFDDISLIFGTLSFPALLVYKTLGDTCFLSTPPL